MTKDEILLLIYDVAGSLNEGNPPDKQLVPAKDTVLFGHNGRLDSLGLVNFIVVTEQKIEEKFGFSITLADQRALSQDRSPFQTMDSLAEYISVLIKEQGNG